MANETYNGWANYQTWNWALWLNNDQGSQEYWEERAAELLDRAAGDREEAEAKLAAELAADCEENEPDVSGPYADLLRSQLQRIDWHEIATHYMTDAEA